MKHPLKLKMQDGLRLCAYLLANVTSANMLVAKCYCSTETSAISSYTLESVCQIYSISKINTIWSTTELQLRQNRAT